MGGKLGGRALCAITPGQLLHLQDDFSGAFFLVDTGSGYSILPCKSRLPPSGPALIGADGQPIPSWGQQQHRLSFGGQVVSWAFLLADIKFPILGIDFI